LISLLALLVAPAVAQESYEKDFRGHIDQAKFFIRRKWYKDAEYELEASVKLADGKLDPEAWFMLAQVRYELTDVEGARDAAKRSHTYARTDEQLAQAAGFSQYLLEQFGVVEVRAPHTGMNAALDIQLESVLFDPNLKLYLERVDAVFGDKVLLPKRFGLPAGTYRINGRQISIEPNDYVGVDLRLDEVSGKSPLATVQVAQVEISAGGGAWLGGKVSNLYPSLTTQIAYTQPLGPIIGGVMLDWTPQAYQTVWGAVSLSSAPWTLGGRVGVLIPGMEPLQVRPSIGYRYGYIAGFELPCADAGDSFACQDGAVADVMLYSVGRAHVPLFELSIELLDRKKSQGVGFGVKGVVEEAIGTLPESAEARRTDNDNPLLYTIGGERTFTATGFRVTANLSIAF